MKIASIQLNIAWEDKQENLKKAERFIKKANGDGCDLVVFLQCVFVAFLLMLAQSANADVIGYAY